VTEDREDIAGATGSFPFPCIVKPVRSFNTPFPSGKKNFVAESSRQLVDFYRQHPNLVGKTLWQEIIEGDDDSIHQCTLLIRKSGEVGPATCVRKIRQYMPGYGIMSFGHSERNDCLVTQSVRLLNQLNYRGLASLEFKYRSDGRCYFIEMNPRLPWYNSLFADANVNISYFAYLDLTESGVQVAPVEQRNDVYWLSFTKDLGSFLRKGKRDPVSAFQWLRSILAARSHAWWDWRDAKPFLASTLHLLGLGFDRMAGAVASVVSQSFHVSPGAGRDAGERLLPEASRQPKG
jgi:predicted ATP-grasp superfamily ATP-dependent carboligase